MVCAALAVFAALAVYLFASAPLAPREVSVASIAVTTHAGTALTSLRARSAPHVATDRDRRNVSDPSSHWSTEPTTLPTARVDVAAAIVIAFAEGVRGSASAPALGTTRLPGARAPPAAA